MSFFIREMHFMGVVRKDAPGDLRRVALMFLNSLLNSTYSNRSPVYC